SSLRSPPPRPPRPTLFPYTTLFRSLGGLRNAVALDLHLHGRRGRKRPARTVIDELRVEVIEAPKNREPRPLRCAGDVDTHPLVRSEEHTSELQSRGHLVCRLLLEKK